MDSNVKTKRDSLGENDKKREYDISLQELIEVGNNRGLTYEKIIADPSSDFVAQIEKKESYEELISIMLNVLDRKQKLIKLYKIAGQKHRTIAKRLGISASYVSKLNQRANQRLRILFNKGRNYTEKFSVKIENYMYYISFELKDTEKLIEGLAKFWDVKEYLGVESLPDYRIIYDGETVTIQLPAILESFLVITYFVEVYDN